MFGRNTTSSHTEHAVDAAEVEHAVRLAHLHVLGEDGGCLVEMIPGEDTGAREERGRPAAKRKLLLVECIMVEKGVRRGTFAGVLLALRGEYEAVSVLGGNGVGVSEDRVKRTCRTLRALVRRAGEVTAAANPE